MKINWKISKEDEALVEQIAARAIKIAKDAGIEYRKIDAIMDLTACHLNGNPLRLAELLAAKDFDFAHDVLGIRRHLNRETAKLENFFSPRYTAQKAAAR